MRQAAAALAAVAQRAHTDVRLQQLGPAGLLACVLRTQRQLWPFQFHDGFSVAPPAQACGPCCGWFGCGFGTLGVSPQCGLQSQAGCDPGQWPDCECGKLDEVHG